MGFGLLWPECEMRDEVDAFDEGAGEIMSREDDDALDRLRERKWLTESVDEDGP